MARASEFKKPSAEENTVTICPMAFNRPSRDSRSDSSSSTTEINETSVMENLHPHPATVPVRNLLYLGITGRGLVPAPVHQVSDWCSGVAIKMGRRQGATKEHI